LGLGLFHEVLSGGVKLFPHPNEASLADFEGKGAAATREKLGGGIWSCAGLGAEKGISVNPSPSPGRFDSCSAAGANGQDKRQLAAGHATSW
jgi:hypothetical protein